MGLSRDYEKGKKGTMGDLIDRQAAIDAIMGEPTDAHYPSWYAERLEQLPSAQPERLTDDDFETIRIHLNAYKEELCNQRRWKEAGEYQRIIDRFMEFASAQPEPAIPLSWIENHIAWLKSLDNSFSALTALQISTMVQKWKDEQNERSN